MSEDQRRYLPVPIQEFIQGAIVPVDLYVKLNDNKYIMVSKAGTKTDQTQLQTYENKTVEYLWVQQEDYALHVRNNVNIAGIIVTKNNLDVKKRIHVLSQAASSVFNEMTHIGIGFEAYSHSKQIVEATIALSETHTDLLELFMGLKSCSDELLKHSLAVCCVSVLIAKALGWENKQTIEKMALGALLHDIGLKTIPPEIVKKSKHEMTYDELQTYEQHPFKGMQLLLGLGMVPDDVVAIVYEHHENAIGQGYPRKLRSLKMHPLARVVAVANEFCNLTIENPNCKKPRTAREALLTIEVTMGQPHNKEAFRALQLIVNKEFAQSA